MTPFLSDRPKPDTSWRAVVLFGRNVASYKFALAQSLLEMAERPTTRVLLSDLAEPFSRHLCQHLARVDRQGTSRSSRFLDTCRAFNRDEITATQLRDATIKLGFVNVIDAFHMVGKGPVPHRFFMDERTIGGPPAIRLTDELYKLRERFRANDLAEETEARWRLVEGAWQYDLPRANVAVQLDSETQELFVQKVRRVSLSRVRPSLNGYQKGHCFYCGCDMPLATADVDHFFPWMLRERGLMPDADGIWNLVLACRGCNRGEGGKFASVPSDRLVARLHARNSWLVESHHPLRETILLQTGQSEEARRSFLRSRQQIAHDALIHTWEPAEEHHD
ncbi:hypothetical protein [Komagataeibacter sp. NFXK3]